MLDSGATTHITPNRQNFVMYNEFPSPKTIGTADHRSFKAHGIGKIKIKIKDLVNTTIELTNILYAPGCTANLLSVNALTIQGNSVNFIGNKCTIFDKSGRPVCSTTRTAGQLYAISAFPIKFDQKLAHSPNIAVNSIPHVQEPILAMNANTIQLDFLMWHKRLGHIHWDALRIMIKHKLVNGLEKLQIPDENPKCGECVYGKMSVAPYPTQGHSAVNRPLSVVALDFCGPFPPSINNKRYMLVFIDMYSQYIWPFFVQNVRKQQDV